MESSNYTGPNWNERDKCFFIKYRAADGKRKTKAIPREHTTKEEARAWVDKAIVVYRNTGKWPEAAMEAPATVNTIRSLSKKWLTFREHDGETAETTFIQYESNIRVHVLTTSLADEPIEAVSPPVLRAWIQEMRKDKAPNTARNIAATLTAFFKDVRGESWAPIPANPMKDEIVRDVIPSSGKEGGEDLIVHLSIKQLCTLVTAPSTAIPPIRRVRHLFAATSGTREGETNALAWKHVKLKDEIPNVEVERQLTTRGKLAPPKRKSYRTLPLHPLTAEALAWWRKVGWTAWVGREAAEEDPVFPGQGGQLYRPHSAHFLRSDLVCAELSPAYHGHNIEAHALRRSFSTFLADAGVHPDDRAVLMGHKSRTVTDRHYTARNLVRFVPAILAIKLPIAAWTPPKLSR